MSMINLKDSTEARHMEAKITKAKEILNHKNMVDVLLHIPTSRKREEYKRKQAEKLLSFAQQLQDVATVVRKPEPASLRLRLKPKK